ncbi:MAG TPA: hypothetical protein VN658_00885 [Candidatus Acidoferrales bacterium]|nr:hypothetical protein [Candidatus Acidoferrales bacterium]
MAANPLNFLHDLLCDRVLMLALAFQQVHEWHLISLEVVQGLENLWPIELIEAGNGPLHPRELRVYQSDETWVCLASTGVNTSWHPLDIVRNAL